MSVYKEMKDAQAKAREKISKVRKDELCTATGMLRPGNLGDKSLKEIYRYGTWMFTKLAMSTIMVAAEELGWEKYVNLLGEYQRPAQAARINALCEKYGISKTDYQGYALMAHTWAKGCLFDVAAHGGRSFLSDDATSMCNDRCPQIEALREMDLEGLKEVPNMYNWCDCYDNMFLGHMNDHCWYSHCSCLGEGKDWCISYMRDEHEKQVEDKGFYEAIKSRNDHVRNDVLETLPNPDDGLFPFTWRPVEDVDMTAIAKDGPATKGSIALESILCAIKGMGIERFLEIMEEKCGLGFKKAAQDARFWANIEGREVRDAIFAIASNMFAMDFGTHIMANFDTKQGVVEAPSCKIMDYAKQLGLEAEGKDMCQFCQWYWKKVANGVNPDIDINFTHCCAHDGFCRAVIEKKED